MDSPALIWLMAQRIERVSDDVQTLLTELRTLQAAMRISPPQVTQPRPPTQRAAIVAIVARAGEPWRAQDVLQALKVEGYETNLRNLRAALRKMVVRGQIQHVGWNQYQAAS